MKKLIFQSLLVFFFSLLSFSSIFAQQNKADSLLIELSNASDVKKVEIFSQLCDTYFYIDTKKAIEYGEKGVTLAIVLNLELELADNYGSLGYCYINTDNAKALEYTGKALELRIKLKNDIGIAQSYNVMGIINYYQGNYLLSVDYHLKALRIREEKGTAVSLSTSYNNLALVHIVLGNYEEAIEYLNKALKINLAAGQMKYVAIIYDNIGDVYSRSGRYQRAIENFTKALTINREIGNKKLEANSTFNFAVVYEKLNDTAGALKYYLQASEIYEKMDEKNGIANVENGLAGIYKNRNDFNQAIFHASKALINAQTINSLENISLATKTLQTCYSKTGDYKKAFEYLTMHLNNYDSLKSSEKIKKIAKVEFDFKMEKIKEEQLLELNRVRYLIIILSITLFLLLIIGALMIWGYVIKKRSNESLSQLNLKLQEMNSTKDKFFSIVAHDMKAPFQGLLGYSQVLSEDYDNLSDEDRKQFIHTIYSLSNGSFKLLENLLNWSRLQAGNLEYSPESIDLTLCLQQTIELISHSALDKSISLENKLQSGIMIIADRNMLETIVRNLISNAIKFTNSGGKVTISSELTDDFCVLSISDTGVGMSENAVNNLFKIEINNSTKGTNDETGTGLGLLICKDMVELHGGKLLVESKLGKGSIFTFNLKRNFTIS